MHFQIHQVLKTSRGSIEKGALMIVLILYLVKHLIKSERAQKFQHKHRIRQQSFSHLSRVFPTSYGISESGIV